MFVDRIGWPERGSDLARVGTLMEETCMRKADALMACSANIADFTAQRHGVPRSAIDVVHCGVDSEAFQPGSVAGGAGRPAIAFVGNIAGNKGVLRVLDAVLRLRGRYPDLLLRIAGKEEGDTGRDIRARLRREGAESAVEFLGFVGRERIRDVYRAADLFCSPAVHEPGVANVYIEAMACGVPVIAGTTGGAAEAVKHGITGLLVPPDSTEALVEALDRLLADPDARRRMGTAARAWVDEYFAMDRYIDRILAVYARARICSEAKKRAAAETAGC
jgi:glycosyltransferase involved in cell wall biosynthesis